MASKQKTNKRERSNDTYELPIIRVPRKLWNSRYQPLVVITLALIIVFVLVKLVALIGEVQSLIWASNRLDYVVTEIEKDPIPDHTVTKSRSCFNIETTPFETGKLRCAVGFTLTVTGQTRQDVGTRGANLLSSLSNSNAFGPSLNAAADNHGDFNVPDHNLFCHVNSGWDTSSNDSTKAIEEVGVGCETDAVWAIYSFVK